MRFTVSDWIHVTPFEEVDTYPGPGESFAPFVQVFDAEGARRMLSAFEAEKAKPNFVGMLVDLDHESCDSDKRTTGAAYITELDLRDDGLWGRPRWSDVGLAEAEGGRVRFCSPTIPPDAFEDLPARATNGLPRRRPLTLDSIGLTNRPRCTTLKPISNCTAGAGQFRNTLPGAPAPTTKGNTTMKLTESTILALLAAVGLPSDATDEQVQAKLGETKETMNRGREYPGLKTRHDALVESVAESDLDASGIKDKTEREAIKPMLISNRAGTLALLKRGEKPAKEIPKAPVHNRAGGATPPSPAEGEGDGPTEAERVSAARISNRASELLAAGNGRRNYSECFAQARAEEEGRE